MTPCGLTELAAIARRPPEGTLAAVDDLCHWLLTAPAAVLRAAVDAVTAPSPAALHAMSDLEAQLMAQQRLWGQSDQQRAACAGQKRGAPAVCLPLLPAMLRLTVDWLAQPAQAAWAVSMAAVSRLLLAQYHCIVLASMADPSVLARDRLRLPVLSPDAAGHSAATLTPGALRNRSAWPLIGQLPLFAASGGGGISGDSLQPVLFVGLAVASHTLQSCMEGRAGPIEGIGWSVFLGECAQLLRSDAVQAVCATDDELAMAYSSLLFMALRCGEARGQLVDGTVAARHMGALRRECLPDWAGLVLVSNRSVVCAHVALAMMGTV